MIINIYEKNKFCLINNFNFKTIICIKLNLAPFYIINAKYTNIL
jgi:hypothetical protein